MHKENYPVSEPRPDYGSSIQGATATLSFFFFYGHDYIFFNFNWRLITLQYCDGFCHTFT